MAYKIEEKLIQEILNYLSKCPCGDVYKIVESLLSLKKEQDEGLKD